MSPSPTPDSLRRTCIGCCRELRIDEFPFRVEAKLSRRGKCRQCLAGYMRTYRAGRRAVSVDRLASAIATADRLAKIEAAFAAAMRRFGGIDAFARLWREQFDTTAARAPGSRQAVNLLLALARLGEVASDNRPKEDFGMVSDEDLEREIEARLVRMIAAHPELAIWRPESVDSERA